MATTGILTSTPILSIPTETTTSTTAALTTSTSTLSTDTTTSTSTTSETSSTSTSTSSSTSTTTSTSTSTSSSTTTSTSSTSTSTTSTTSSTTSSAINSFTTPTLTQTQGVTQTVVIVNGSSSSSSGIHATSTPQRDTSSSNSFLHNKGALAGVFTVVGLVALVIVIALATNAVRRRRAKKFDEEVAAAAAEANKAPHYPFDDYDDDLSGSLSQPPLAPLGGVGGESYNMSEYPGPTGYGHSYNTGAAAMGVGAAGVGVNRAISRRDNTTGYQDYNAGYQDYNNGQNMAGFGAGLNRAATLRDPNAPPPPDPFGAFAAPPVQGPYDVPGVRHRTSVNRGGAGPDLLEAAGIGGVGGAYLNRDPSQSAAQQLSRKQSQGTTRALSPESGSGTAVSSATAATAVGNASQKTSSNGHESYAAHYAMDFRPDEYKYHPPPALVLAIPSSPATKEDPALPNPFTRSDDEEAYGADSYVPTRPEYEDSRLSLRDDDDYGRVGRTLKVANE